MILKDKNGREVEVHVRGSAHDDVYIESGCYVDTGEEAPEGVLDDLQNDFAGEIEQQWLENQIGRAEAFYEGER